MNTDENIATDTSGVPPKAPPKPDKDLKFSYFEPIVGIIVAVIVTVIFLGFSQIITIVFTGTPPRLIPTFDVEVIRSLWIPIVLWAVLRIGVDVVYLIERCYTQRLAKIAVIGNVLTAIVSIIILFSNRIVYWEYADFVRRYFEDVGAAWFGEILARPNLIILVIILIVLVVETINVIKKGQRAKANAERAKALDEEDIVLTEIKPDADQ